MTAMFRRALRIQKICAYQGRPVCRSGNVTASAERLITVRHFWWKKKRMAEIRVPAAQASDRYELNDGTLEGAYEFYQEYLGEGSCFGAEPFTRSLKEMMVPTELRLYVDRSSRCELANLQVVPRDQGWRELQAELMDSEFKKNPITIELDVDLGTGRLVGERKYSVDERRLTDELQLRRISFELKSYKIPSSLVAPL